MNPHDPLKQPGAHLVAADLGVDDPWDLSGHHPLRSSLDVMGRLVATAAHEVDDLHSDLTRAAQSAIELLEPIGRGEHASMRGSYGVLRTTGPQIELLVARRGAAYEHLTRTVSAYQRLLPAAAAPPAPKRVQQLADDQEASRDDDWAVAGDRQIVALQTVEQGGLRLCRTGIGNDPYLSDGSGSRPTVLSETVERMLGDGLLTKDTSTSTYDGQLLSLTPNGQAALRAAGTSPSGARPSQPTPSVSAGGGRQTSPRSGAALPTFAQFKALQEIERGEALLLRGMHDSRYVYTGTDVRISASTAEALWTNQWIGRDISTSLSQGQRLSLTDLGQAALSAARAAEPRVTAALSRSSHPIQAPASPNPHTPPASPASPPSRSPSCSR